MNIALLTKRHQFLHQKWIVIRMDLNIFQTVTLVMAANTVTVHRLSVSENLMMQTRILDNNRPRSGGSPHILTVHMMADISEAVAEVAAVVVVVVVVMTILKATGIRNHTDKGLRVLENFLHHPDEVARIPMAANIHREVGVTSILNIDQTSTRLIVLRVRGEVPVMLLPRKLVRVVVEWVGIGSSI